MLLGVYELSLNNIDWILKYFFVYKKFMWKYCNIYWLEMRGYGSSCFWLKLLLNGYGEENYGKWKIFKSMFFIYLN